MCSCGLGSFLLQDMFLNLPAFALEGQNKKFTLTPSRLMIRTVCKYSMLAYVDSYHGYHICHRIFFFGDAVAQNFEKAIR